MIDHIASSGIEADPSLIVLPWYRRSKFQAWLLILFIVFGAVAGIPLLLIFWTGKTERPRLTSKLLKRPYYSKLDKVIFSLLIIGFVTLHFLTVGM